MNTLPFTKGRVARLAGLATLTIAGLALTANNARAEEWTKSYTINGRAHVRVGSNDGSVRVSTSDTKQVEFVVIYEGYKMDKNLTVTSRQDGDQVEVSARVHSGIGFNWGINHRTLRVEVHMPREADLNVDTGDGSVEGPWTSSLSRGLEADSTTVVRSSRIER